MSIPMREEGFGDGPYLLAALLCQGTEATRSRVTALTGLFDTILVTDHGEDAPAEMQPFGRVFQLFVKFASGWWRGHSQLMVSVVRPTYEVVGSQVVDLSFEGPEHETVQQAITLELLFTEEGTHWIELRLDGRPLTRIPLRIRYRREAGGA
jgi:hypothetical protein